MIYCMADIHGAYDRYLAMLQTIHFCDDDTLYVIGDVIDRGHQSIEVVLDMISRSNVVFLRGNHEQMCLDDLHRRLCGNGMEAVEPAVICCIKGRLPSVQKSSIIFFLLQPLLISK